LLIKKYSSRNIKRRFLSLTPIIIALFLLERFAHVDSSKKKENDETNKSNKILE
jgi:hypothetical protein